jgi:hypothetical protein
MLSQACRHRNLRQPLSHQHSAPPTSSQTQRKRNGDKSTALLNSTAQSAPARALATVTAYNTPNFIDSSWGLLSGTSYGPYWNSTAHLRQPSTQGTWTTGYETRYAPTPPYAGSCNIYSVQKLFYFYINTTTYTGGSSSHYARPITITSSILILST